MIGVQGKERLRPGQARNRWPGQARRRGHLGRRGHLAAGGYGRLRPSRSWASTHSSATIAEPSEISPHKTVAATTSANLRTLPLP